MNARTFFIVNDPTSKTRSKWRLLDRERSARILLMRSEYEKYWSMIERGENFMLLRYGDGERKLMLGQAVRSQEGWSSEKGMTDLGRSLLNTLNTPPPPRQEASSSDARVIFGISCPCCDAESYFWYLRQLPPRTTVTLANIWVNANFARFKQDFARLRRDAVLITNYRGKDKSFGRLNVIKHYLVDDDCIKFWESDGRALIRRIIDELGDRNNLLYACAAGPLSEVILCELFKHNPNNCYIDFGSALDQIVHGKITRPYMDKSTAYARQDCWIFDNSELELDIDVVLTAYKRPHLLAQQLSAVRAQSVAPKNIFLFQDAIESYYSVELKADILSQFNAYGLTDHNVGVWGRFEFARQVARSKYVCLFDDDTIPGARWFENCLVHSLQHRGVYGTNGILMKNADYYPRLANVLNAGWHTGNEQAIETDFVGHSWFIEREYLDWMMRKPYARKYKYVGEDMCLSFACQEHGIATYVPPHPRSDESLWGSMPTFGFRYGTSEVAVSINSSNTRMMNKVFQTMHSDGWQFVFERDPEYIRRVSTELGNPIKVKRSWESDPGEDYDNLRAVLKRFMPLVGKKYPVFLVERKYIEAIKKIFGLRDRDCIPLDNSDNLIKVEELRTNLMPYALHIIITDVYDELKAYIERLGLRENEDFLDGRGFLVLGDR